MIHRFNILKDDFVKFAVYHRIPAAIPPEALQFPQGPLSIKI